MQYQSHVFTFRSSLIIKVWSSWPVLLYIHLYVIYYSAVSTIFSVHVYQCFCIIIDGWFLLGSSALTGNVWDGGLSIFSGIEDYLQCPNLIMVACNTPSGVNDAVWCVNYLTCVCVRVFMCDGFVQCTCTCKCQSKYMHPESSCIQLQPFALAHVRRLWIRTLFMAAQLFSLK